MYEALYSEVRLKEAAIISSEEHKEMDLELTHAFSRTPRQCLVKHMMPYEREFNRL